MSMIHSGAVKSLYNASKKVWILSSRNSKNKFPVIQSSSTSFQRVNFHTSILINQSAEKGNGFNEEVNSRSFHVKLYVYEQLLDKYTVEVKARGKLEAELHTVELLAKSQIGKLEEKLEQVTKDAELSEFLLYVREQISQFEKNYCSNLPSKNDYVSAVGRCASIFPSKISENIHFRRWLWYLLTGDEIKCTGLTKLRSALNNDEKQYVWFAHQMEVLYDVLCEDVRGKSPLEIKYLNKHNLPEYIKFFSSDVRSAVQHFMQSLY